MRGYLLFDRFPEPTGVTRFRQTASRNQLDYFLPIMTIPQDSVELSPILDLS